MQIGVVKEIKPAERRVALTPAGAHELVAAGHQVRVERGAGIGASFDDAAYQLAGAQIVAQAADVWSTSELLLKVKEPIEPEYALLHDRLTLFTYLHLAPNRPLTEALLRAGTTAIAYETVEDGRGHLPLLAPMSEVAGRLATQAGAYFGCHPGTRHQVTSRFEIRPVAILACRPLSSTRRWSRWSGDVEGDTSGGRFGGHPVPSYPRKGGRSPGCARTLPAV